jgi:Fic-DOC domain mobile mystery protein B
VSEETEPFGATPGFDASELLLPHLTSREALNAAEFDAVDQAYNKYVYRARKKRRGAEWLTEPFIREVHVDMFGSIWGWAGKYRDKPVNIGMKVHVLREEIKKLCDDFRFWDSEQDSMPVIEIAARLQNRLTRVHAFVNGNGRHARLITDIFFRSCDHHLPQWPQIQRLPQGDTIRLGYIAAMKKADIEDYSDLIKFIENCLAQTP